MSVATVKKLLGDTAGSPVALAFEAVNSCNNNTPQSQVDDATVGEELSQVGSQSLRRGRLGGAQAMSMPMGWVGSVMSLFVGFPEIAQPAYLEIPVARESEYTASPECHQRGKGCRHGTLYMSTCWRSSAS